MRPHVLRSGTTAWVLDLNDFLINLALIVNDAGVVVAIADCDLSLIGALA